MGLADSLSGIDINTEKIKITAPEGTTVTEFLPVLIERKAQETGISKQQLDFTKSNEEKRRVTVRLTGVSQETTRRFLLLLESDGYSVTTKDDVPHILPLPIVEAPNPVEKAV